MKNSFSGPVGAIKTGLLKSARTLLLIAKIIIPVTCLVSLFEAYSLLDIVTSAFSPVLKIIGLPGEGSLVLTLGYFVSYYASLGVIGTLSLPGRDVTVLGVMISLAHDLFSESAVCKLIGWSFVKSFLLRLAVSLVGGFMLYRIYLWVGC